MNVRSASGFSLVETMVGLLIGMLTVLVVMQVMVFSASQRRTAMGGASAQVNGALALYSLEREISMSGYGLASSVSALGCEIHMYVDGDVETFALEPVTIEDGTDGAPDTIRVMASDKPNYSVIARVSVDHPKTAANFFINSILGIVQNDLMIAVPTLIDEDNWCSVFQVTNVPGSGGGGGGQGQGQGQGGQGQNQLVHNSGLSIYNAPGNSFYPDTGYQSGSLLINLGQFTRRTFSLSGDSLQMSSFDIATGGDDVPSTLYTNIVNLQAQYAKDTDDDGTVDTYDVVTPTTSAGWQEVLALRVLVVARSPHYEKEEVTVDANAPTWSPNGSAESLIAHLDAGDRAHYRYRVFQTLVPLRNLLWRE